MKWGTIITGTIKVTADKLNVPIKAPEKVDSYWKGGNSWNSMNSSVV
jgi:hypothetical protein